MKFRALTFLTICAFLFFSCTPVLKIISGVKDIRIESIDDLKTFCVETGIDLKEAFYYRAEKPFEIPDSSQINFQFADLLLIFNKEGKRIIYQGKETGYYCRLPGNDFFSGLNTIFFPLDSTVTLNHLLSSYRNIESDSLAKAEAADFYLVYYWAKWHRKLTKNSVKDIRAILSNSNDSITIQSFFLNNDFVSLNYPDDVEFKKLKLNVSF